MSCRLCTALALTAACGLAVVAFAQPSKPETPKAPVKPAAPAMPKDMPKSAPKDMPKGDHGMPAGGGHGAGDMGGMPDMSKLPGMTPERLKMMESCMTAGQMGEQHKQMAKMAGVWDGKCKSWMMPDQQFPAMESACVTTFTSVMDGRYVMSKTEGDMPGMGKFEGHGTYAYDTVSGKFQNTWIDSWGTGIMTGVGERSSDGKTTTFMMNYNCPYTKKQQVMREVETMIDDNRMTLEMFGTDPITSKEYKMMEISYTRRAGDHGGPARSAAPDAKTTREANAGGSDMSK